jgi:hypothetical protein
MLRLLGLTTLLMAATGFALAGNVSPSPEIDASTGVAALTLLSGGLLILRARRHKR